MIQKKLVKAKTKKIIHNILSNKNNKYPLKFNKNKTKKIVKNKTKKNKYLTGGNNDEEICSICLDTLSDRDTIKLSCDHKKKIGHTFHKNCIYKLVNKGIIKCPMCRANPKELLEIKYFPKINKIIKDNIRLNNYNTINNYKDKENIKINVFNKIKYDDLTQDIDIENIVYYFSTIKTIMKEKYNYKSLNNIEKQNIEQQNIELIIFNKILDNEIYFNVIFEDQDIGNIINFYLYIVNEFEINQYYGIKDLTYRNNLLKSVSDKLVDIIEKKDNKINIFELFEKYFNDNEFITSEINKLIDEKIIGNLKKILIFFNNKNITEFIHEPEFSNKDIINKFQIIYAVIGTLTFYLSNTLLNQKERLNEYNEIKENIIPQLLFNINNKKSIGDYKNDINDLFNIIVKSES